MNNPQEAFTLFIASVMARIIVIEDRYIPAEDREVYDNLVFIKFTEISKSYHEGKGGDLLQQWFGNSI